MTLTMGVLVALWVAVENFEPTPIDTGPDAGVDTAAPTATDTAADAGPDSLSPHEREEAAKDELERARAALERGDLAEASAALDRASAFDSDLPDIAELRQQILALQPDGG
jgi:hypothetical protein